MKKHFSMFKTFFLVVFLSAIMTSCNSADREVGNLVGKWESKQIRSDGYSIVETRIELVMRGNGKCLQRTSSGVSGKVYQKLKCTFEVKEDTRTWITYDDGRVLHVGLEGRQLVIYDMFRTSGYEQNAKFDLIK